MPSTVRPVRLALAGIRGFGSVHLETISRLGARVQLVAAADPADGSAGLLPPGTAYFSTVNELLESTSGLDIVIIATPIPSHAPLAIAAMEAGADVYVEKPTASSLEAFHNMHRASARTGRSVQVGFQSLGSHALPDILEGSLPGVGRVWAASAYGAWLRRRSYWTRSPWAGRRMLAGDDVVDGVVTNPLAHSVATALAALAAREESDVESVVADLYRANDIEADDTSVVRAITSRGSMTAALTLAAPTQELPYVTLRGELGDARFWYTEDVIDLPDGSRRSYGRTDLVENLIEHHLHGTALLSSLADTGAFMRVLEAVRTTEPVVVSDDQVEWVGTGDEAHPVVRDIEHWLAHAADQHATFSELGAPWARPRADTPRWHGAIPGGGAVTYQGGGSITATSSPRPYLHPVVTPNGILVSDHHPADHDWHCGLGVAIQDVNGTNFWGGRTYVRDRGYVWRDDHGRVSSTSLGVLPEGFEDQRDWIDPAGHTILTDLVTFTAHPGDDYWSFGLRFVLCAVGQEPVSIGSPGSNGRAGGGYGGLFWRLPACTDTNVRTPDARGESAVHGSRARWLGWSARFAEGEATVVLAPASDVAAHDPWFVRVDAYPGLGSALAWDMPVRLEPGQSLERSFHGIVADGLLSDKRIEQILEGLQ
jgi:predicted dehydrogenase